jgi:hypothetical protein
VFVLVRKLSNNLNLLIYKKLEECKISRTIAPVDFDMFLCSPTFPLKPEVQTLSIQAYRGIALLRQTTDFYQI